MENSCSNVQFCFWDKHDFEGPGVMCPIFYKPKQIVRKKREYYLNQNISRHSNEELTEPVSKDFKSVKIIKEEFYYDDMFCSYKCCLAWIEDNYKDPKYKYSKSILYNELFSKNIKHIVKANHWRTLKKFGGFLSIEDFRGELTNYEKIDSFYDDDNKIREKYAVCC